jgi:hypothetical protein
MERQKEMKVPLTDQTIPHGSSAPSAGGFIKPASKERIITGG